MAKNFIFVGFICLGNFILGQESNRIALYKGNQSFMNKNFDEASSHYLKAIEKNKENFDAHYNLANTLYRKKMYSDAISEYKKAIDFAQNNNDKKQVLYNLGNAQFLNKNKKEAIESYQKALKIDPKNKEILKNLRIVKKEVEEPKSNKNNSGQQPKEKQNNSPNQQENKKEKTPKNEQEENLLKYIENKEQETAKRALNKSGYAQPQSNQKDW